MASTMTTTINDILKKKQQPLNLVLPKKVNTIQTSSNPSDWDIEASKKKTKKSADELYKLAVKNGLQEDADRVLKDQAGEETNKIFSGGFISDTFDVLNALQYGVTGVLKGKGFMEGIKTRQSFSDKDALGDKGLPGIVAGIALDIAVDPLTYIAPWTVAKKIPVLSKLAKVGKETVFGKQVTKVIAEDIGKLKTAEVPIDKLKSIEGDREMALADFKAGKTSKTDLPVLVRKETDGSMTVLDGNGRIVQAENAGKKTIKVTTDESTYRKLTEDPRTYETVEGGTKAGKYLAEKFKWMFGQDPIYKSTWERSIRNIGIETQNLSEIAKKIVDLPAEASKKLLTQDEVGRFWRVKLDDLKGLKPEEFKVVSSAWNKLDNLGKQAVDLGILDKAKYEENLGEYIKNAYKEYEQSKNMFGFKKVGIKGIKARKTSEELATGYLKGMDINKVKELYPKAVSESGNISTKALDKKIINELANKSLQGIGRIDQAAYLLFKGSFDLLRDVENAKLFKQVNSLFGKKTFQEGFKQLPDGKRLGALAGKWVPENIFNHIQEITEPIKDTLGKKLIAGFKYNKVILNPATHARNIMSNTILNWWKLGLGPWRADIYGEALRQATKGGEYVDEAKTVGYNLNTFASNELKSLLDSGEARQFLKGLGGVGNKVKNKLVDIYQQEENIAKLAAFIYQRKQGLPIEQAWKLTESATFNYAQVTPFIRKLRTSLFGMPFITFSIKSAPIVAETMAKAPGRISVFGKIKNDIEKAADIEETERERASEPAYMRDGFYIKLPIKDKQGRSAYFDLTYIIPFGDLVSGSLFQRQIKRDTGLKEGVPEAVLSNLPFIQTIKEITRNQDFYGDKIWKDADTMEKQLADLTRHLSKTYMPPLVSDQIPGGYKADGTRRTKGIYGAVTAGGENQQRNLMQELLKNVGAKIQPVDVDVQEYFQEANRKKALENLLMESGKVVEYKTIFEPKK